MDIRHVAIVMDGNGRWAEQKGLSRTAGHQEGLKVAKKIVQAIALKHIPFVTLYVFSTENWKRTQSEVSFLMELIRKHLHAEFSFYLKHSLKVRHLGDISALPQSIQNDIISVQEQTAHFNGTTVALAINYGGRDEILRAIKKIPASIYTSITESTFQQYLDYPEMPAVDLLIRTGGQQRISNFLLWHNAYAELYFTETLWPDFTEKDLDTALETFTQRERKFGGLT